MIVYIYLSVWVFFHSILLFGGFNYRYYGMTFALKKNLTVMKDIPPWTASSPKPSVKFVLLLHAHTDFYIACHR